MLLDLREQLQAIATPPELPHNWQFEVASATAGGDRLGGDIAVPALTHQGRHLEIVLVDVSGKGRTAGTRALLLAGAVSGLLGVVPPERFLAALNAHLLRLDWEDGFATAVHVSVDLRDGRYVLSAAGHPAPVHYHAGSGRWASVAAAGPLLGVFEEGQWPATVGHLEPGDALMAYTDGAVEGDATKDVDLGLDRLLGRAERLVLAGFTGAADNLLSQAAGLGRDDVSVAMLWRTT